MKTTHRTKRNILGAVAITTIGLFGSMSASAWGPERATFTMNSPASYPTFNSITDNPLLGDERNFVRVGELGSGEKTDMKDEVKVVPGKQYEVRIFFHNDASATYNDEAHNRAGIALGTTMSSSFTKLVTPKEKGTIVGTITASNSKPTSVWDEAYMTTDYDNVILKYVEGSATIHSDWAASNTIMPSSLFTQGGAPIGLNALDGIIPGCDEYSGSVTYILQAYKFDGEIDKVVSKDGKNFTENAEIKAGEKVTFKISTKNDGAVALKNVTIKDTLPAGLAFVPGSVKVWVDNGNAESVPDAFFTNGYGIEQLGVGKTINISYEATASIDFKCKGTNLVNSATVTYTSEEGFGGSATDTAKVTVLKENCEEDRKKPGFEIDKKTSFDGKDWKDNLEAKPGDTAKFMITFKNTGQVVEKNVIAKDVMNPAAGLEYVSGTILVTRGVESATARIDAGEEFFADGVVIGDVNPGETITITYDVKFTTDKFDCGTTTLYNNASISGKIGDSTEITTVNDSVEIKVTRTEGCDTPKTDCKDHPEAPECNLPNTGPVEIAMAIAITLGIAGGGYYFYRTKKSLKTIEGAAAGTTTGSAGSSNTTTTDTPSQIQMEEPKEKKEDK